MRIGILGGGIAGLACAHYLAKEGHTPVVFEASPWLGQMGEPIVHEGVRIDRTSNALRNGDTALCGLLAELGGLGRIVWRETRSAVAFKGLFHPTTSARDLLGHKGMASIDTLRAGLGLAYATQFKRYAFDLDRVPAVDWLPRVFGRRVFEQWWRPFLDMRFGEYADEVPAYWVWRQLNVYQPGRREVFGYIRGGIGWLTERLRRSIETRGGEVRLHARVSALETHGTHCAVELDDAEERFDAVVSTLAPAELTKISHARLARQLPDLEIPYQGRVTALVIARNRLGPYFQTAFLGRGLPFHRVIEATHIAPSKSVGGRHLIYVRGEFRPNTDPFNLPDDVVKKQALEGLSRWFPEFDPASVEAVHVSRNPDAEPITRIGQMSRRLPLRIPNTRVLLCTSAQAYPRPIGWDSEVTLARETAAAVDAANR